MDNRTLSIALVLYLLIQSVGFFIYALQRSDPALRRFLALSSASLASAGLGFATVLGQAGGPDWLGVLVFNTATFGFVLLSFAAVRSHLGLAVWPRRYVAYLVGLVLLLAGFTYLLPSYPARVLVVEGGLALAFLDQLASVRKALHSLHRGIRGVLRALYIAVLAVSLFRLALVVFGDPRETKPDLLINPDFTVLLLLAFLIFVTFSMVAQTLVHQRENEEIRRFFQVSPYLILVTDPEGRFLEYNEAWTTLMGYAPAQIEKARFFD